MSDERCPSHGSIIAGYARAITFSQAHCRFRASLGTSSSQLKSQLDQGVPILPADFYGVRGAGFTSPARAIGAGLLHLDDPDRLRATAAALAAPTPPEPERLGERERRQWLMLTAQLFGTGKRWRPLPEALALLWQAAPWIHREGVLWHEPSPLLPLHPLPRPGPRPLASATRQHTIHHAAGGSRVLPGGMAAGNGADGVRETPDWQSEATGA